MDRQAAMDRQAIEAFQDQVRRALVEGQELALPAAVEPTCQPFLDALMDLEARGWHFQRRTDGRAIRVLVIHRGS